MSTEPLLPSDRELARDAENDHIHKHILWFSPSSRSAAYLQSSRGTVQRFLASKFGHYAVLLLVSLDVSCIFADFIISLWVCEHSCGTGKEETKGAKDAQAALGIVSLVFTFLFMAELVASVWAFGFGYFKSKFHCFDAAIIIAGFIVDVCLKSVLDQMAEEVGSIIVVLRLWRVFKIIEEFSAGAEEQLDKMAEKLEKCQMENAELKKENSSLKKANENRG